MTDLIYSTLILVKAVFPRVLCALMYSHDDIQQLLIVIIEISLNDTRLSNIGLLIIINIKEL